MNAIYIFYNLEENTTKFISLETQFYRSNVWLKLEFKATTKTNQIYKTKNSKQCF